VTIVTNGVILSTICRFGGQIRGGLSKKSQFIDGLSILEADLSIQGSICRFRGSIRVLEGPIRGSDTLQGVFPGPHPAKGVKKVPNGGPQGVIWGGQNRSLETPKPWDLSGVFGPRKVTPRGGRRVPTREGVKRGGPAP